MYKLLVENFRHFIKESVALSLDDYKNHEETSILYHNMKFLRNSRYSAEDIEQIPPLKYSKIIKFLGSGCFGVVYLLDNDHVLKLFYNDNSDYGSTDLQWYEKLQNKQFGGRSDVNSPMIYDYGKINSDLKYVEMSKVIPLEDWLEMTGRGERYPDLMGTLSFFFRTIRRFFEIYSDDASFLSTKQFYIEILSHMNKKEKYYWGYINSALTIQEIFAFIKASISLLEVKPTANDVNRGNVGILIQSPHEMVIYDS